MPTNLAKSLPTLSADELATLFGNLSSVLAYPRGNPIREGVIDGKYPYLQPITPLYLFILI